MRIKHAAMQKSRPYGSVSCFPRSHCTSVLHFYGAHGGPALARVHLTDGQPLAFGVAQLLLTALSVLAAGYRFYTVGFSKLLRGQPNMDSLIAVGTGAAFVYGLAAVLQIFAGHHGYAHELYFETAGVIITLILLGRYLEAVAKGRTSEAIKKLMGWPQDSDGDRVREGAGDPH